MDPPSAEAQHLNFGPYPVQPELSGCASAKARKRSLRKRFFSASKAETKSTPLSPLKTENTKRKEKTMFKRKKEKDAQAAESSAAGPPASLDEALARIGAANNSNGSIGNNNNNNNNNNNSKVQNSITQSTDDSSWDDPARALMASALQLTDGDVATVEFPVGARQQCFSADLSFNKLTRFIPDDWCVALGGVLRRLDLSGNAIGPALPPELGLLNGLIELRLAGNQIAELPASISYLSQMERLYVQNNALRNLPPEIACLRQLEELNVSGNSLQTLPSEIGELRTLQLLDLSGCELTSVPDSLTHCTRLIELNLGNNRLTMLPAELGRCTRLSDLNVADNSLDDLPLSLGKCAGLSRIGSGANIDRNPMSSDPTLKEKAKIGSDHLHAYLEKRMMARGEPKFEPLPALASRKPHGLESIGRRPPPPAKAPPPKPQGAASKPASSSAFAGPKPTFNNLHGSAATNGSSGSFLISSLSTAPTPTSSEASGGQIPASDDQKMQLIRDWSRGAFDACRTSLRQLTAMLRADSASQTDVVKLATLVKDFTPLMEAVKAKVSRKPLPDMDIASLDRMSQLRRVVLQALIDIEFTLDAIEEYLKATSAITDVAAMVKSLKDIKSRIDTVSAQFPDLDLMFAVGGTESVLILPSVAVGHEVAPAPVSVPAVSPPPASIGSSMPKAATEKVPFLSARREKTKTCLLLFSCPVCGIRGTEDFIMDHTDECNGTPPAGYTEPEVQDSPSTGGSSVLFPVAETSPELVPAAQPVAAAEPVRIHLHIDESTVYARVIEDYLEPAHGLELQLQVGDILKVVGRVDADWWKGDLYGEVGLFKGDLVEPTDEEAPRRPPPGRQISKSAPTQSRPSQSRKAVPASGNPEITMKDVEQAAAAAKKKASAGAAHAKNKAVGALTALKNRNKGAGSDKQDQELLTVDRMEKSLTTKRLYRRSSAPPQEVVDAMNVAASKPAIRAFSVRVRASPTEPPSEDWQVIELGENMGINDLRDVIAVWMGLDVNILGDIRNASVLDDDGQADLEYCPPIRTDEAVAKIPNRSFLEVTVMRSPAAIAAAFQQAEGAGLTPSSGSHASSNSAAKSVTVTAPALPGKPVSSSPQPATKVADNLQGVRSSPVLPKKSAGAQQAVRSSPVLPKKSVGAPQAGRSSPVLPKKSASQVAGQQQSMPAVQRVATPAPDSIAMNLPPRPKRAIGTHSSGQRTADASPVEQGPPSSAKKSAPPLPKRTTAGSNRGPPPARRASSAATARPPPPKRAGAARVAGSPPPLPKRSSATDSAPTKSSAPPKRPSAKRGAAPSLSRLGGPSVHAPAPPSASFDASHIASLLQGYREQTLKGLLSQCESRGLPEFESKAELVAVLWRADLEQLTLRQLVLVAERLGQGNAANACETKDQIIDVLSKC